MIDEVGLHEILTPIRHLLMPSPAPSTNPTHDDWPHGWESMARAVAHDRGMFWSDYLAGTTPSRLSRDYAALVRRVGAEYAAQSEAW